LSRELTFPRYAAAFGKVDLQQCSSVLEQALKGRTHGCHVVFAGLLQVHQLKLKASIVDAADLPFMCTSGEQQLQHDLLLLLPCTHQLADFFCVTACVKDVLIAWPWWRGPAMSVTVSGLALRGKTRSLPQVSITLCWTS
jgi:hypothetical protein